MSAIISLIYLEITRAKTMLFWRHWLFADMQSTEEDKILVNNLFDLKGKNGKHLVREFPSKSWNIGHVYQSCSKSYWLLGGSTIVLVAADRPINKVHSYPPLQIIIDLARTSLYRLLTKYEQLP